MDDKTFENVAFYTATIAVPARRNVRDPQVFAGQKLFAQAQCAACHRPTYVTGNGPFPRLTSKALSGQTIHPYTDLLLHDMGPDLADQLVEGQASGSLWRTSPLWGIGYTEWVAGRGGKVGYLHDGRARTLTEAFLWHGGETTASRQRFEALSTADREALLLFLGSL